MKSKTDANIEAAKFLITAENGIHCNASIHCSYYAALQYMKYILNNLKNNPISYEKQKEKGGVSSHDYIYGEVLNRLNLICNTPDIRKYKCYFSSLRKYRIESDYNTKTFSRDECLTCKEEAENLICLLRSVFKAQIA